MLFLALPAPAVALTLPRADIHVTVESNGVLDVLERVLIESRTTTVGVREISMKRGDLFAAPSVVVDDRALHPGDARRSGFRILPGTRGVRIEWHEPPGAHEVRIGFRLANRATAYRDVVDLRIPVWENELPGTLKTLSVSLQLPRRARFIRVWVHSSSPIASIVKNTETVRVRARDVGTVELRVVFPRAVLASTAGTRVVPRAGLTSILAEERGSAGSSWWIWVLFGAAAVFAVTAVVLRRGRWLRPRRR
jgi:hypothetical protein